MHAMREVTAENRPRSSCESWNAVLMKTNDCTIDSATAIVYVYVNGYEYQRDGVYRCYLLAWHGHGALEEPWWFPSEASIAGTGAATETG